MAIGFRQPKKKDEKKNVQSKPKDIFVSLLRENYSPEQTAEFSELQYLTTAEIAYKFEEMTDVSKSSLSRWMLDEGYHTTTFEGAIVWQVYSRLHK